MKNKVILLLITVVPMAIGLAIMSIMNSHDFDTTKQQLDALYHAELTNCEISEIIEEKFEGRGNYKLFKTKCGGKYMPILLQNMTSSTEGIFKVGSLVTKKRNSYELLLVDRGKTKLVKSTTPDDWGEDWKILLIIGLILLFITSIGIFRAKPNSLHFFLQ